MCTAMTLRSLDEGSYIGRNMDFSYDIQPHFYCVPQNYEWSNALTNEIMRDAYSFIGIGQALNGVLAFFDGVNEHGFAAAALYFAGYAHYDAAIRDCAATQIAAYDFLHYILGSCASLEDLCVQMNRIHIAGLADPLTQTAAPLHWIAADQSGRCVVLEKTKKGVELFNNRIGVLANSPDFRWHMTNLRNYMQASPHQAEEKVWGDVTLTPFGQAGGTVPLPGGYTSPERFVRTAYLKTHIPKPDSPKSACVSFFQVMKSVSIPKGAVLTARGTDDYTQYTACIDMNNREYFFNTYDNLQIKRAGFPAVKTASATLVDLGQIARPMRFENL
jgi:penicillin V acylase-like amidase (Ntn superfamily)